MGTGYIRWSKDTKPQLNTWYRCINRDDLYKILKEGRDNQGNINYRVVSYRKGINVFCGLTLKEARTVIRIETYRSPNYGGFER